MITGSVERVEQIEGNKANAIKDTIDNLEKDFGKIKGAMLITHHEGEGPEPRFVAFGMSPIKIMIDLEVVSIGVANAFRSENEKQETKSEESNTENQAQA